MIDQENTYETGDTTRLEDAGFADDIIGLLSHPQQDIQEKINKVDTTARTGGLKPATGRPCVPALVNYVAVPAFTCDCLCFVCLQLVRNSECC